MLKIFGNAVNLWKCSKRIVLLGYLLDPFSPRKSNYSILETLLENNDNINSLVVATNKLCGRFIIIFIVENMMCILNDATGFRSVFYSCCNKNEFIFAPS